MTKYYTDENVAFFNKMIEKSFYIMTQFSVPLIICTFIMAPQIVYVLAGSGYEGAVIPMRIILPAIYFVAISQVLAIQTLLPYKKDKILFLASSFGGIIGVTIAILIVPKYGSIGASFVLLCSEVMVTLIYAVYVVKKKILKLKCFIFKKALYVSFPSVMVCVFCSYIDNQYYSLLIALVLALLLWVIINRRFLQELFE